MVLARNELSGEIPPGLANLSSLFRLELGRNRLTGRIPRELGQLRLGYLNLSDNQLSGEIPAELAGIPGLRELELGKNRLTGNIPPALCDAPILFSFYVNDNQLTGEVPPKCFQLDSFEIEGNNFTQPDRKALVALYHATGGQNWNNNGGWLSAEPIGSWYGVETTPLGWITSLHLADNGLAGEIPRELGDLPSLASLDLSSNRLTGVLPPELGDLSALVSLNLSSNRLTGVLPPELGDWAWFH